MNTSNITCRAANVAQAAVPPAEAVGRHDLGPRV
jgi:hypothetical protein